MLIGITGKAGSGKDTFAKYFIEQLGFERYGFADPIKRMIEAGFNLSPGIWEDRQAKETDIQWLGRSPRFLAQVLGTEWGRGLIHNSLWLLLAEQKLLRAGDIVIPDVRFDNEAQWILAKGGAVYEITRDKSMRVDNVGHVSENGISPDLITQTVHNFGTIADLHRKAQFLWNIFDV